MAGRKGSLGCFGFGGLSGVAASALDTSYNQLTVSKTRTAADHRPRPQNISYLPVTIRLKPSSAVFKWPPHLLIGLLSTGIDSSVVLLWRTMWNTDTI